MRQDRASAHTWFDPVILVVAALGLLAALPFLTPGFPAARDSLSHLFRTWSLDTALRTGELYPRWLPDYVYGYGYPLFNFYGPLLYYLAEAIHLAGLDIVAGLALTVAISSVVAATGAYLLARDLAGRAGGFVAAASYVSAPYFQTDLIVRGAFPEALGMAILPWALWLIGRSVIGAGIALAALVLAHNAAAVLGFPLVAAYAAWQAFGRGNLGLLVNAAISVLLGLGLSAFFWIPAIGELGSVWLGGQSGAPDFLAALASPLGIVQPQILHEYQEVPGKFLEAGLVQVLIAVAGTPFALRRFNRAFFVIVALSSAFVMSTWSAGFWQLFPFASLMAFPWRIQAVLAIALAAIAGCLVSPGGESFDEQDNRFDISFRHHYRSQFRTGWRPGNWLAKRFAALAALGIGLAALLAGLNGVEPVRLDVTPGDLDASHFARFDRFSGFVGTTSPVQFRPRWVATDPTLLPVVHSAGQTTETTLTELTALSASPSSIRLNTRGDVATKIRLRTFFFPGWQAEIDGRTASAYPDGPDGLLAVDLPPGDHQVVIWFGDTILRLGSMVTSVVVLALVGLFSVVRVKPFGLLLLLVLLGGYLLSYSSRLPEGSHFRQARADLGPFRLLGYRLEPVDSSRTGRVEVRPLWQIRAPTEPGWKAIVRLVAPNGSTIAEDVREPVFGTVSAASWTTGDLATDRQGAPVPPATAKGTYRIILGWRSPAGLDSVADVGDVELQTAVVSNPPILSDRPANVLFDQGIKLIGSRVDPIRTFPLGFMLSATGTSLPPAIDITLVWQVDRPLDTDYSTFIHLGNRRTLVAQADSFPPLDLRYTSAWPIGRPVVQRYRISVPSTEPGRYDLTAGLFRRPGLERLRRLDAPSTEVVLSQFRLPANNPAISIDKVFGPIRLLGYDRLDHCGVSIRPPCQIDVRLIWRAERQTNDDLTVFLHLVSTDGRPLVQADGPPAGDPTSAWKSGDVVADRRTITVPAGMPPGDYRILVGWYRGSDGSRLPVLGDLEGQNAVDLAGFSVGG